jgi:hypothetical protein
MRPLRGDSTRGLAPFRRSGRGRLQSRACDGRVAYLKQYVDRPSGEPARRQVCRSGVSAVSVEAFVDDVGKEDVNDQ